MIVKDNLHPAKVFGYVRQPLLFSATVAVVVVVARRATGSAQLAFPLAPVATLGAAVSIFVAFRNNASYGRWWEARTVWANIHNSSRVLARQLVAATDNAIESGSGGAREDVLAYRRELVLRIVAFAHALRLQLRDERDWTALSPFVSDAEYEALARADNKANLLLQRQAVRIKDGVRDGIVGQFDPITLEPNLAALNASVAACERIKTTPTPRQYDYFTRRAVLLLALLLPFGLESVIPHNQEWLVIVLSVSVAGCSSFSNGSAP
ncbi:MAG: bestrophin family ion channel [Acidimicrobiales bacterium]